MENPSLERDWSFECWTPKNRAASVARSRGKTVPINTSLSTRLIGQLLIFSCRICLMARSRFLLVRPQRQTNIHTFYGKITSCCLNASCFLTKIASFPLWKRAFDYFKSHSLPAKPFILYGFISILSLFDCLIPHFCLSINDFFSAQNSIFFLVTSGFCRSKLLISCYFSWWTPLFFQWTPHFSPFRRQAMVVVAQCSWRRSLWRVSVGKVKPPGSSTSRRRRHGIRWTYTSHWLDLVSIYIYISIYLYIYTYIYIHNI